MSLLSAVCTLDGIWFKGRPRPPSGVLPITVICGSSWAVAGLLGGPPDVSAADAEIGIAAAAARYINNPNCRIGLECATVSPFNAHARGGRVATGVLARHLFLIVWRAPTAHGH